MPQPPVVIAEDTVIVLSEGKTIAVNDKTAFVIDSSILDICFAENIPPLFYDADYLFAFLAFIDFEKENRRAIVLDKWYLEILEQLKDHPEQEKYFQGHCQSSKDFIGEQTGPHREELIALISQIVKRYPSVLFVTEDYSSDWNFIKKLPDRCKVVSLTEAKEILSHIPNFKRYVASMYESSG